MIHPALRRFHWRLALVGAGFLAVTVQVGRAQQPPPPAGQPPQTPFRSAVDLVSLNVTVTEAGKYVTDLNAEDFAITEDGKPQEVVSFERRMVADTASSGGTTTGSAMR